MINPRKQNTFGWRLDRRKINYSKLIPINGISSFSSTRWITSLSDEVILNRVEQIEIVVFHFTQFEKIFAS